MNKKQENRLTMYEGLLALLKSNTDRVKSIGGFADSVAALSAIIAELKTKSIEVDSAAAGKTSAKHDAEEGLLNALLPICSALYMFGRKQNASEIRERVNITESRLRRMRDTEFASFGAEVAGIAEKNARGIAQFGISAEKIAELKARAQAYTDAIGVRESSVAERMGARGSMNELFDRADELLSEEIDRFMEILRPSDDELYNKYYSTRSVKDTGVRHRQVNPEPEAAKA